MANRGKFLIGVILFVAMLAAGFAWWFQYRQGQRVMALWGPEAAYRIRMAATCQLLTPGVDVASGGLAPDEWAETNATEISKRPGFVHARQALIHDASYDWPKTDELAKKDEPPTEARWQYMLRFCDDSEITFLLFDLDRNLVHDPVQRVTASVPGISRGLQTFIDECLAETAQAKQ